MEDSSLIGPPQVQGNGKMELMHSSSSGYALLCQRRRGWWLLAAIAVFLAASLLFRRCLGTPSGQPDALVPVDSALVSSASDAPEVVRDTVYVRVEDATVPVVRERKVVTEESGDDAAVPVETVVSIPVKEISGFIREKSGRDISLATQTPDRIIVSLAEKVDVPLRGEKVMTFSAAFRVVEAKGDHLVLQLDSGTVLDAAAEVVAPLILERLPAGLVESFSGGRAVINLTAVPQFSKRLSGLSITGITVDDTSVRFATVKK